MSKMESGQYTIVIQADNTDFAVQRKFTLTVGSPEKTVVTVCRREGGHCIPGAALTVSSDHPNRLHPGDQHALGEE